MDMDRQYRNNGKTEIPHENTLLSIPGKNIDKYEII